MGVSILCDHTCDLRVYLYVAGISICYGYIYIIVSISTLCGYVYILCGYIYMLRIYLYLRGYIYTLRVCLYTMRVYRVYRPCLRVYLYGCGVYLYFAVSTRVPSDYTYPTKNTLGNFVFWHSLCSRRTGIWKSNQRKDGDLPILMGRCFFCRSLAQLPFADACHLAIDDCGYLHLFAPLELEVQPSIYVRTGGRYKII